MSVGKASTDFREAVRWRMRRGAESFIVVG